MAKYTVHASVLVSFEYELDTDEHGEFIDSELDPNDKDEVHDVAKQDLEDDEILIEHLQEGCSVDKVSVTITEKK